MWTTADFQRLYAFLADMKAVLGEMPAADLDTACRSLLLGELEQAKQSLNRICDGVNGR